MKLNRMIGWILGLMALVALVAHVALNGVDVGAAVLGAVGILPFLGTVATAPLKEEEFQGKVLGGLKEVDTRTKSLGEQIASLTANYDNLSKETKGAFEDLTKLKKHANESQARFDETVKKLGQVDALLRREARMAFGSPIQRIQADEELRTRFNMAIRLAVADQSGDMLRLVRKAYPEELVKKALGEDSSPGSTVIDDALSTEIYDTLATYGVWNTFRVQRLGTKQTKFPVKTARPVANFILTEAGTIADDTNKAGASVTLEVEVIAALLNVSLQLIQDAEIDITADVLGDFAEAFALRMDYAALRADGTADATNGGMTGVFSGGTASVGTTGRLTVEATKLEDWTKALLTVDAEVLNRPARWWLHPQMIVRALSVVDSNGRPIFLTATEAPTRGGIGSILGYPVTLAQAAPTANAANAKIAVFGDPAGNVVGVRQDFTFEASDHHRWNTFERSFRGVGRAGTKIRRSQSFAVLTLAAS